MYLQGLPKTAVVTLRFIYTSMDSIKELDYVWGNTSEILFQGIGVEDSWRRTFLFVC